MSICYLDVDDEITAAIKRLRAITDGEALVVVPPGSRIATSRINFRLIAREAAERRLNIAAVSDEPGVRALAIAAGLAAYDSVATAEAALKAFREQDRELVARLGGQAPRTAAERGHRERPGGDTAVLPKPTRASGGSGPMNDGGDNAGVASDMGVSREDGDVPENTNVMPTPAGGRRRRRRRPGRTLPVLVLLLIVLLVGGVAYGAYVFLPTATITLRPNVSHLASPTYTITADPNVAVADPAAGVVGAQRLELPVSVNGEFPASGVQVSLTAAHGTVRFRSTNTLNAVPVPAGTVVSTSDGIDFETTDAVTVPTANFATNTKGTMDVHVRASVEGPRGNVAAGAITKLPANLKQQLLTVTNPDATSGGARDEQTVVAQSDYDAAMGALNQQLQAAVAAALADPANVPRGLTVYATTAVVGDTTADPASSALVGTAGESFTLTLHTSVSVIAVNESLVNDLGESRFRSSLADNQKIVGDTVDTSHAPGSVVDQTIVYQVMASADVYTQPNEQQVLSAISGKSVSDARAALSQYGNAEIQVWPSFIDHLPDQAARIRLTVVAPQPSP